MYIPDEFPVVYSRNWEVQNTNLRRNQWSFVWDRMARFQEGDASKMVTCWKGGIVGVQVTQSRSVASGDIVSIDPWSFSKDMGLSYLTC